MKITIEIQDEYNPNETYTQAIYRNIDIHYEAMQSVCQTDMDCSPIEYISDMIKEFAEECADRVQDPKYQEKVRREFDEYYPARPVGVCV